MTTATTTQPLTNEQLAKEFLVLFKNQYRGIRSVVLIDGLITVTSTVKSAKSLLRVSRDLCLCGFSSPELTWTEAGAKLTCKKLA